jgi:hypothetical protein
MAKARPDDATNSRHTIYGIIAMLGWFAVSAFDKTPDIFTGNMGH